MSAGPPIATYEDVRAAGNDKNVLIIDVRASSELEQTGTIPGSINIPLNDLEEVLRTKPPEEFKTDYGREKPQSNTSIIVSCRSGRRASEAQQIAFELGYTNVKNYVGSWLEWAERNK